jgi:AraC-like DNA-binding protein
MAIDTEHHTVLSNIALAIARAASEYGCDGIALLADAGIDPDDAQEPDSRISVAAHQRLWRLAIDRTDNPCLAIKVGEALPPGAIHGLGLGWLASDTLKSALERLVRFQRLVSTNADIQLTEMNDCYELIGQPKRTPKTFEPASADALMVLTLRLCRLALSESVAPDRLELAHNPGTCLGAYQTYFGCTVVPNAPRYALVFNKALMKQILPGANPLLARINDDAVRDYLARYELADFATQVRRLLIETLTESGSDQAAIARELNVSVRQLQRELQERGLTFKTLVEEVRRELAISYLTEKQKSIGEITYLLGYTEPANFGRSFKKWTGQTPAAFRASA